MAGTKNKIYQAYTNGIRTKAPEDRSLWVKKCQGGQKPLGEFF